MKPNKLPVKRCLFGSLNEEEKKVLSEQLEKQTILLASKTLNRYKLIGKMEEANGKIILTKVPENELVEELAQDYAKIKKPKL